MAAERRNAPTAAEIDKSFITGTACGVCKVCVVDRGSKEESVDNELSV